MVTNDVFHPSSRLHSSLWLLPFFCDSRVAGEAPDLVLGFNGPTIGVSQRVEVVRFQCGQASQIALSLLSACCAVSRILRGLMGITDWRLQGYLRVAAV
jgi:hypothetical protein